MVDSGSEERLRIDMHCHTRVSFDCVSGPADIVRTARARGLDRLVVTDHNEIDGALQLREAEPELIVVGEEVKTREGVDIIGIFLSELIPAGTPAFETCERIRAQGGVVYVPHPFDTRRSGGGILLDELVEMIDVVEVHNSRSSAARNRQAEVWAERHGMAKGAGSDAHTLREIGRGVMEIPPFEETRDSFLASLASGRLTSRTISSPVCRLWSGWARVRKLFPGA
jgi:predicted metal-dependent phosphoesterase TrpH